MVPFRSNSRTSRRSRRSLDRNSDTSSSNPFEWQAERDQYIMTFPMHPLPSMQAPFEESMLDATGETGYTAFPNPNKNVEIRQQQLCKDNEASELEWNFTYNCHWRNNPKGKFHPLLKTLTQIVFGVHLLHQHLEKSVADVADILLKHVNELDSFLQHANEDIEGSLKDMLFRRKCLKVPMEHVNEFDRLLEDRMYRAQLLDGNITIERTINRTSELLNDYLVDMSIFRDANAELDIYLSHIGSAWAYENEDVGRIYSAMCGNTAGWSQFLQSLVTKAEKLGVVLVQVSSYCNEIEKRCGAASRRSLIASRSSSRSTNSRDAARSFRNFADNKPLPSVPNERPPFMTQSSYYNENAEDATLQRHPSVRATSNTPVQIRTVADSDSEDSLKEQGRTVKPEPSMTTSTQTSSSDVTVLPREHNHNVRSENFQEPQFPSSGQDQHISQPHNTPRDPIPEEPQASEQPLQTDSSSPDTVVPKRIVVRNPAQGDHSPPLTGKDSAYSSVSGGSFASPTAAHPHPRSASASGSYPRAQFGLFPSAPSTPKHSLNGRHGPLSPSFSPPATAAPEQPVYYPERAQTSLSHRNDGRGRLLKKSSLSSLRRLFGRKKSTVETIAE